MLSLLVSLAERLTILFTDHPYLVLLVVLALEEGGVPLPLPGDLLVLAAGAAVAGGYLHPLLAGLCVVVAAATGSTFLYTLGRYGGRRVLVRWGHLLRLTPPVVARMERWLATHPSAVIWSRFVPGFRIVTSFAGGTFQLPWPVFLIATSLSAALWAAFYLTLGALLGPAALQAVNSGPLPATSLLGLLMVALLAMAWAAHRRGRLAQ